MSNYFKQSLEELYTLDENKRSELNTLISQHRKPVKLIVLTSVFAGLSTIFLILSIVFSTIPSQSQNVSSYPSYLATILLIIGAALLIPSIIFFVKLMNRVKENNESNRKIRDTRTEIAETERVIDIKKTSGKQISQAVVQQQSSNIDVILKYKQLLDAGAITQEEYDAKKKELLNL